MRVVIIEDESFAAKRLESMIKAYDKSIEVIAKLESVEESLRWFSKNEHPDLIFLDIQLEDDLSFVIFDKIEINVPIIFTTAYDEYAIKAFKLKSIDYLLKPIVQEELNQSIEKLKNWTIEQPKVVITPEFIEMLQRGHSNLRERFSVSVGEKIKTIKVDDISYFFSTAGITFVVLNSKSQYSMDLSLDSLAKELDPKYFYRVNRQYLVKLSSISNIHIFPKSRLKLELTPPPQDEIFVSLDKVPDFKRWLDGRV